MTTDNTMKTGTIILLVSALAFLTTCNNLMDSLKSGKETGTVTFSVAEEAPRTVVPTIEIASYELWGGKTPDGNQTLIGKFGDSELRVILEVGVWNFTLNVLNAEGTTILQDTQEGVTVTARDTESIIFSPKPFSGTGENGSINIMVNYFPQIPGIDQVEITFNNQSSLTENLTGGAPYIFERNNVPPGDYQLILTFKNTTAEPENQSVMTIMEIIKVMAGLKSEKVIQLAKPDPETDFFTDVVQGADLEEKMNELYTPINNYRNFLIEVTGNTNSIYNFNLYHGNDGMSFPQGVSVTLRGTEAGAIVNLPTDDLGNMYLGNMFTIGRNVTLTLENITLQGHSENGDPLVYIMDGGTLILNNGSKITGNSRSDSSVFFYGGGVYVANRGSLIMNEGEISGNSAITGGGVFVEIGGSFKMNGGVIAGNTATDFGGGVFVLVGGSFTMNGGRITGDNIAPNGNGRSAYYNKAFGFFRDDEINGALSSDNATNWQTPPIQNLTLGQPYTATSMGKYVFSFTAATNYPHELSLESEYPPEFTLYDENFNFIENTRFYEINPNPYPNPYIYTFNNNFISGKTYYIATIEDAENFEIALNSFETSFPPPPPAP